MSIDYTLFSVEKQGVAKNPLTFADFCDISYLLKRFSTTDQSITLRKLSI